MRTAIQSLLMFGLSLIVGYYGLPEIQRKHLGQTVREDGPKTHYVKSGTPTFGGLFFVLPMVFLALLRLITFKQELGVFNATFLLVLGFAVVGFVDDYTKVKVDKAGLSVWQKTLPMLILCLLFALYYLYLAPQEPFFRLPFSGNILYISGLGKIFYLIFIVLYLFFVTNSVNLSDGLDGLCSSMVLVSAVFLTLAFHLLYSTWDSPLQEWCYLLIAGCAAFLFFNHYPAKIFMGDVGSLALGAALACIALWDGMPWLIAINALVIVAEGLSTIIQTTYFKLSGGHRVFRMAPLHHHFELGGWPETKVVRVFTLVSILCGCLSLLFFI